MALKPKIIMIDCADPHVDRHPTDGAAVLREASVRALSWTVLADPAGNEFCVAG